MVTIDSKYLNPAASQSRFFYITGCDGTGKTTQARKLISYLEGQGISVRSLYIRYPVFLSAPLLAYARLGGYSWYEGQGKTRQGYWYFRDSWLLRVVFPWIFLLDAFFATILHIHLPRMFGKTIVCERFVLDMIGDLSIALGESDFHKRLPGWLYLQLLPADASIIILTLDIEKIRKRRKDLRYDRRLQARLETFATLAKDQKLMVVSSELKVAKVQRLIREEFAASEDGKNDKPSASLLKMLQKKLYRNPTTALLTNWLWQGMLYMDPTERWFKLFLDALLTGIGAAFLSMWFSWPISLGVAFLAAHTINFLFNGQLFALLKNYGIVHTSPEMFEQSVGELVGRAKREPSIASIAAFGSVSRQSWSQTSDFDARIIRKSGFFNGVRACWFLLRERTIALFSGFPLDMYVLDNESLMDTRIRSDEKPIILVKNTAVPRLVGPAIPGRFTQNYWDLFYKSSIHLKVALLNQRAAVFAFILAIFWIVISAAGMDLRIQDRWILDGIWLPLFVMLIAYASHLALSKNAGHTAILTAVFVWVALAMPPLKYAYVYATTIDASVHLSHIRSLTNTGFPDQNFYQYTAGLHSLIAAFSQLTGVPIETSMKIIPPAIGGLFPLGIYMLSKRLRLDIFFSKTLIAISALSLPLLYYPTGTAYATLIVGPLVLILLLYHIDPDRSAAGTGFLWVGLLLLITLITWHGFSSILVPGLLIFAGFLAFLIPLLFPKLLRRIARLRKAGKLFFVIGLMGIAIVFLYWSINADALKEHFLYSINLLVSVLLAATESDGVLVPERTFSLDLIELLTVMMINHARDVIMLTLAAFAVMSIVWSTWVKNKYSKVNDLLLLIGILAAAFLMVVLAVLASTFSKFGYHRFLKYVMIVIPVLSGMGLWSLLHFIARKLRISRIHLLLSLAIFSTYLFAGFQIFPYQPGIPAMPLPGTAGDTPAYYEHKVNSDYQRRMIEFAYFEMDPTISLYTDYVAFQQTVIFIDEDAKPRFRTGKWEHYRTSYVLLHHPGIAGPYAEQAEYRSPEAIQRLRQMNGVSVVYDNGESFILLVPRELMPEFNLEGN
jgi:hypothetical protein